MKNLNTISDSLAGRAAMLGGAAFAAGGITSLIHSQRNSGSKVVGVAGHLVLSFFIVAMIGIAPSLIALARRARPGIARRAGVVAATGALVLGLTTVTSVVNGRDLGLFMIVAPLTNAAWLFGSVVIAVSLRRSRTVSPAIATGLPLVWLAALPLSTYGGAFIAGAYFMTVGYLLSTDGIARRPHHDPALARS